MTTLRERIGQRLRDEVCVACRQEDSGAKCDQASAPGCPLMDRLDEVMEVIASIRDYSLEPYRERLRQIVCTSCQANETGECTRRDARDCPLDAYFPKIVAIIEKELAADPGLV